jgi:predicted P-loop ATPase
MASPLELEERPRPNGSNGQHYAPQDPRPDPAAPNEDETGEAATAPAEPKAKKKKLVVNTLALVNYIETRWRSAIRINLFTENMTVSEPFPPNGTRSGKWRQFREPSDQLEAMLYFQSNGFPRASKGAVIDALLAVGHRNAFHPVADYLASLKWDGEKRLAKLFHTYFNAEIPTDAQEEKKKLAYLAHTGQCFMVSAVARIRVPGCKVDHLPVLVGDQGFNKSRAIRALCRDEAWFSDDLSPDLVDKDTKDSLVGKWLIELAEIPHVRKEVERVKAFFSRQTDRYRRAYDRMTSDWPRQCVFMGSSNDLELIDTTGNRRFWPVEVAGPIDVAPIERDRDQLWAEAVHMFEAGFQWWLPPDIEAIAGEEQERFREEDIWIGQFESWLAIRGKEGKPFTLAAAMCGAFDSLFQDPNAISKADQMCAAGCLKTIGYKRRLKRIGESRQWLWSPGKKR